MMVGFAGQEPWCVRSACTYGEQQRAGPNDELTICSTGRNIGLLNLAV